jgi:hypothetical protein
MSHTVSSIRKAALEGLNYAAYLVDYFGWEAPSPEGSHLDLGTTLNLAACKIAADTGEPVYEIEALMGYLLDRHLKGPTPANWHGLTEWQAEDGRTAVHVAGALRSAAA